MVGIFSRFSVGRAGHRRTQSALDEREVLPPNPEVTVAVTETATAPAAAAAHGIQVAVEFKAVEHPIVPLDTDLPIQCPVPGPSILIKERVSAGMRRIADLPGMKEEGALEAEAVGTRPHTTQSNRMILPSLSAPEHNLLKLLGECNASVI